HPDAPGRFDRGRRHRRTLFRRAARRVPHDVAGRGRTCRERGNGKRETCRAGVFRATVLERASRSWAALACRAAAPGARSAARGAVRPSPARGADPGAGADPALLARATTHATCRRTESAHLVDLKSSRKRRISATPLRDGVTG